MINETEQMSAVVFWFHNLEVSQPLKEHWNLCGKSRLLQLTRLHLTSSFHTHPVIHAVNKSSWHLFIDWVSVCRRRHCTRRKTSYKHLQVLLQTFHWAAEQEEKSVVLKKLKTETRETAAEWKRQTEKRIKVFFSYSSRTCKRQIKTSRDQFVQ